MLRPSCASQSVRPRNSSRFGDVRLLSHATNSLHRFRRGIYKNTSLLNEARAGICISRALIAMRTYTPHLPRHRGLRHPAWRQLNRNTEVTGRTSIFHTVRLYILLICRLIEFRNCGDRASHLIYLVAACILCVRLL